MKLYQVTTVTERFHGHKDVALCWFRCERGEPRPYAELIEGYDPAYEYAYLPKGAIDELFTEAEAIALKRYLDETNPEGETTIEEIRLPIKNNTMSYGALPGGGGTDFLMLDRRPGYPLPFAVWGYYDLRHCPYDRASVRSVDLSDLPF